MERTFYVVKQLEWLQEIPDVFYTKRIPLFPYWYRVYRWEGAGDLNLWVCEIENKHTIKRVEGPASVEAAKQYAQNHLESYLEPLLEKVNG